MRSKRWWEKLESGKVRPRPPEVLWFYLQKNGKLLEGFDQWRDVNCCVLLAASVIRLARECKFRRKDVC